MHNKKNKQHLPAILGLAVSLVCLIIFGADQFLIPSMIGISIGLFLLQNKIEKASKSDNVCESKGEKS